MSKSPAERGFYFPAEWHPHQATWLSWPVNTDTWPRLQEMLPDYAKFVAAISRAEEVHINLPAGSAREKALELLAQTNAQIDKIFFHDKISNDAWCRDHGPSVLLHSENSERLILDWEYNAWGGKYPPFDQDNGVPAFVAHHFGIDSVQPGIVLEGGSVDFNGQGTVLTTTHCLLNPNRNPHLNQAQIEKILCDNFGVAQVLWLGDGIVGDDTDGHVDDITRFVNSDTVITVVEQDKKDDNYAPLQENLRELQKMRLANGKQLNIVELPMPAPLIVDGERLPASYGNFYICNAGVIVPTFNDKNDDKALDLLQSLFLDRPVIGLDSTRIVWGLGSFHCLSQQIPKNLNV